MILYSFKISVNQYNQSDQRSFFLLIIKSVFMRKLFKFNFKTTVMINQKDILQATHFGFYIYKRVLSYYYEDALALGLSGKKCLPAQNPFNENHPTLQVTVCFVPGNDGSLVEMFCHQDTERPDFKGNAFDFAALHYQLSGDELLEKLNTDLNLHIGEGKGEEEANEKTFVPVFVFEMPSFSFYNCPITNTRPNKQITLLQAYHLIKSDLYKERTLELRTITDPEAASQFKRINFDYVTFSGVFSKRSDQALVCHSGLLTLDFDHVENLTLVKEALRNDPSADLDIDMMFESPSGHGLKCITSIDVMQYSHKNWFESMALYLKKKYNLEVDRSGKDVSRACFLCHDPNAWIHPLYLI